MHRQKDIHTNKYFFLEKSYKFLFLMLGKIISPNVGAQKAPEILFLGHYLSLLLPPVSCFRSLIDSGHFTMGTFLSFYNEDTPFRILLQRGHSFELTVIPNTASLACVPEQIPFEVFSRIKPFPLNKQGLKRIFVLPPFFSFSGPKICHCSSFPSRTLLFKSCRSGQLAPNGGKGPVKFTSVVLVDG